MNNPKVLSILNNAKIFLSPEDLKALPFCNDKEVGRPEPRKIRKSKPLQNWTLESVTENLLATQFKSKRRS